MSKASATPFGFIGLVDAGESETELDDHLDFEVDLGGSETVGEVLQGLVLGFNLSVAPSGFDAALDILTDVRGLLSESIAVRVTGLDTHKGSASPVEEFVSLLPPLCDRWRSQGLRFRVLLECSGPVRDRVRAELVRANAQLEEASAVPWVNDASPVEIREM